MAVQGNGIGGRNQHFALCLLEKMTAFNKPFTILCGGTDGSDGPTDATGAIIDQFSLTKAFNKELNIAEYINHFDSYSFFKTLDDLVIIGPTQTNVMDLVIGLFE